MNSSKTKKSLLKESQTIGYMEGFSDGRNSIIEQLEKFGLLKKGWKKSYKQKTNDTDFVLK